MLFRIAAAISAVTAFISLAAFVVLVVSIFSASPQNDLPPSIVPVAVVVGTLSTTVYLVAFSFAVVAHDRTTPKH